MRIENSFIAAPGVGEKTERKLWRSGVTHWDDFGESDALGRKTTENVARFIEKARERLDSGDVRFFGEQFPSGSRWRLYENFRDETCFFDIETTGLDKHRSVVTTVSLHRGGETTTLVRGQDLTRERLQRELADANVLVSFNGKRFDAPFLEHNFDLALDIPHIDLLYLCKRVGLTGGLKQIERELGIGRDGVDIDGRDAVRLWRTYEAGDDDALDRLIEYNRHDTRNLQTLLERVHATIRDDVFAPHVG